MCLLIQAVHHHINLQRNVIEASKSIPVGQRAAVEQERPLVRPILRQTNSQQVDQDRDRSDLESCQ